MRNGEDTAVIAVTEDQALRDTIAAAAATAGIQVLRYSAAGEEFLATHAESAVIVLDQGSFGKNILTALGDLEKRKKNQALQVLVITGKLRNVQRIIESGADDFIRGAPRARDLSLRILAARKRLAANARLRGEMEYYKRAVLQEEALSSGLVDLSAAIKDSEEAVIQVRRALRKASRVLESKNRDPLSGLLNRTGLSERMEAAVQKASSANVDVTGLMIDIDRFKSINDAHGHIAGDAVISAVGKRIASGLRKDDFAGRWGGEEFFAVLIGTNRSGAIPIAGRLKDSVERMAVGKAGQDGELVVTVSIGVSEYKPGEGVTDWIKRADDAMYEAKNAGRNEVRWT